MAHIPTDGAHIWPPRAADDRMKNLTAAVSAKATPDDVFKALRALGHTGSLDDMWKKHLEGHLGTTDTSEPFELDIGDPPLPDSFSKAETWTDGGPTFDLNSIVTDHTTVRISSIDFNDDGSKVIISNTSDDDVYIHDLSTPFDFATGTLDTTRALTNANGLRWYDEGNVYAYVNGSTNSFNVYAALTPYEVSAASDVLTSALKTEFWTPVAASDGNAWFHNAGFAASMLVIESSGNQTGIGTLTLANAYDIDSGGAMAFTDWEPPLSSLNLTIALRYNVGETLAWLMFGEVVYIGTFGTAGDFSTIVWDEANTLDVSADGQITDFWVNANGTIYYFTDDTVAGAQIIKYVWTSPP